MRALPILAAVVLVATGCAHRGPAVSDPGVVWVDRDGSRSLDFATLVSGGQGTTSVEIAGSAFVSVALAGTTVTLTPAAGWTGDEFLPFTVHRGGSVSGRIHVRVKDGTVDCETAFRYDHSANSVAVAGSFNGFSATANPLADPSGQGHWSARVTLPAGDVPYKLVVDGAYQLDDSTALTMWLGGVENSRAVVPDCGQPRLDLFDAVSGSNGTFTANAVFVAASDGSPTNGQTIARVDGAPVATGWDAQTKVFSVSAPGLAAGRHRLRIDAVDLAGRVAPPIDVPFWIESKAWDWRDAIAYFAFTDRFRNGDPGNDAPEPGVAAPANWNGGDWKGIQDAIDEGYFDALGTNVLWISPQVDQPSGSFAGADGRPYTAYHGYWPASPRAAEEHFGGMPALVSMVSHAHAHGMRVLFDVVLNHVHQDSPYWAQHAGAPWFHSLYVCGFDQPINCWFADYLPDLDYQDLDPVKAQVDDAMFWVKTAGADGFRVDAVKHFEHVMGRTLRDELRRRYDAGGSHFYMVGETFVGRWSDAGQADLVKQYVSPRELDGQFDFPLYWEILRTVGRREGTLYDLEQMLRESQGFYGPDAVMGTFLGNHDVPRFVSHANGDISDLFGSAAKEQGWTSPPAQPASHEPYARLQQAFTLLFALPGMPTVYYGDEIGLAGAGDPDNRRMMPWPMSGWSAEQQATHDLVARLGTLRRSHPELSRGTYHQVWREADLLVLERVWEGHYAYVGINRAGTARTVQASVAAPAGQTFVDAISSAPSTVSQGTLPITVPAEGSCLYLAP